jgi:hypothetical protein
MVSGMCDAEFLHAVTMLNFTAFDFFEGGFSPTSSNP